VCGDNFVVTEMKYAASNCVSEIMIHLRSYTIVRELSKYGTKPTRKKITCRHATDWCVLPYTFSVDVAKYEML
jgi:hypothetical protein